MIKLTRDRASSKSTNTKATTHHLQTVDHIDSTENHKDETTLKEPISNTTEPSPQIRSRSKAKNVPEGYEWEDPRPQSPLRWVLIGREGSEENNSDPEYESEADGEYNYDADGEYHDDQADGEYVKTMTRMIHAQQ